MKKEDVMGYRTIVDIEVHMEDDGHYKCKLLDARGRNMGGASGYLCPVQCVKAAVEFKEKKDADRI